MSIQILPSTEVRDKMSQVISNISQKGDACFITQYGKAEAVMISVERFEELMSLVEDVLDEKDELLVSRIEQSRKNYKNGQGVPFEI